MSGLASTMASSVAVLPEPGPADTRTFWVRERSAISCWAGDGAKVDFFRNRGAYGLLRAQELLQKGGRY